MGRKEILNKILGGRIIAILRILDTTKVIPAASAISKGGIKTIEISLNTPDALQHIKELSTWEDVIPGVGTVTDEEMAIKAIKAGADFVVTPITKKEIIDTCHSLGKPVFSGAFTPSEIFQAYEYGADVVKVFPADPLGMNYIKNIKTPFPQIKLMPTGGVTHANIDKWFDIGIECVGVGSSFTKQDIIEHEEWSRLTDIASAFTNNILHYNSVKNIQ